MMPPSLPRSSSTTKSPFSNTCLPGTCKSRSSTMLNPIENSAVALRVCFVPLRRLFHSPDCALSFQGENCKRNQSGVEDKPENQHCLARYWTNRGVLPQVLK